MAPMGIFQVLAIISRKKRLALALLAFIGIVAAGFLFALFPSQGHGRLLDGTRVALQRVSYGTNYSSPKATFDAFFRRLSARWSKAAHWKPSSTRIIASDTPILSFWLKFSGRSAETQPISYAIADEHGFEAPMVFSGLYGLYEPGGFSTNHIGLCRSTSIFPRKPKTFFLRLYQPNGNGEMVRVGEFPVANPASQNSNQWKPESLPVERKTNGFTFALIKAEVGTNAPGPLIAPYSSHTGQWLELRFQVASEGRNSRDWDIKEIWISEEGGGNLRVSGEDLGSYNGQFSRLEKDEIVCVHRWQFWTDQAAWKMQVHFERSTGDGCWIDYRVRPKFLNL